MTDTRTLFVTAPKEMETLLLEELRALEVQGLKAARAGVHVEDTVDAAYRICLWSRIANRVLLPLAEFDASTPERLYAGARAVAWDQHFDSDCTIAVDANTSSSQIRHDRFAEQRIKDAVVDYLRELEGTRPSVDTRQPDIRINTHIHRDHAQLYLDLAGDSLHVRGYRTEGGAAPLKENLAAAVLMRSGWPDLCSEGMSFVDFMCGSGTLLIEAAGIACDVAPGLTRTRFGFLKWKQHRADVWERLLHDAKERRARGLARATRIIGFDNDKRVVRSAQQNVERAGLSEVVKVEYQDLRDFRRDLPQTGLVVINPPYGRRLGREGELHELYRAIGSLLREKFLNWRAAVLTEDVALGKEIGIRTNRIHTLYNGAIRCNLLHFSVREENFFGNARTPRALPAEDLSDAALMLRNRITKNRRRLRSWLKREGIDCYRVYDADLPEYAVAIDHYRGEESYLVVQEYEAPATVDRAKASRRVREVITVASTLFDIDASRIYFKRRKRQRGSSQYERAGTDGRFHEVREGELRLLVNFEDYLDTGLFLDHRPTRRLLQERSAGKSFLNLFAYTGSMTVAAAAGGATRTVTVDLSSRYLEWARENMALNGFEGDQHEFIRADCLKWLEASPGDTFDLIFLDPPTFSNSARMERHFDVQADHGRLIELTMARLAEAGELYFSVNARKFSLSQEVALRHSVTDMSARTLPIDFARRPRVHQCWLIEHRND